MPTNGTNKKALFAAKAFANLGRTSDTEQEKLARGMQRRAALAADLAAGVEATGTRATWLHDTSLAIIALLGEEALEFNKANPDDLISASDLVDALATAIQTIKKTAQRIK